MMTMLQDEARAALMAKGDAEKQLAAAATCPPWRHAIFGALMAALVAKQALSPTYQMAAVGLVLVAIFFVIRSDRKRMGMFINGYRRGKTLYVTLPMLVIDLGLYGLSVYVAENGRSTGGILGLAAVTFLVSLVGSMLWQRVFVSELGASR